MKRPSHTKTGRKISENLTDYEACFAEWFSGDGKSLVKEGSITDAQKFLFLMEKSFIAGMKCHLAAHDAEVAAKAVEDFCKSADGLAIEKCPKESDWCYDDLITGWKAGNVDCRMAGFKYAAQLRAKVGKQ